MKTYKYTVDDFDLYLESPDNAAYFFVGVYDFLENGRSSIEFDGLDGVGKFSASSDDLDNLAYFLTNYYYGEDPEGELLGAIFGDNAEDMLTDEEKSILMEYDPDSFED